MPSPPHLTSEIRKVPDWAQWVLSMTLKGSRKFVRLRTNKHSWDQVTIGEVIYPVAPMFEDEKHFRF